ncbi:PREDICTED: LOW QUALITY PROTEIN: probable succinate-semialdehyde dehydrogenase [NADP(+)], partial [Rhagoletis zephyria]|uniref:LOW QUALITY PROTEIN: probable succinate-semialdehyde dehydrogenase [NADP(+)] n=1 Tax=Rhagoletis zephyria TaxID=28612 RepID=UPI000811A34A
SPLVSGISFIGSTNIGKHLFRQAAGALKRVLLELGGNAPFIVFESGDIAEAVEGAIISKFRNSGQTCVSSNRFYMQACLYDTFVAQLKAEVEALKIGAGHEEGMRIGPLINAAQLKRVEAFMKDARQRNAKVLCDGKRLKDKGPLFNAPDIITDYYNYAGKFETEDDVVCRVNKTLHGLAAYFYSQNVQQVFRVARRLEVGMVGVNVGLMSQAEAPFGGIKESSIGRDGSHHDIDEFTEWEYICLGGLKYNEHD